MGKEKRKGRGRGRRERESKVRETFDNRETWVHFHNMKLSVYFSLVCNNGTQHVRISSN